MSSSEVALYKYDTVEFKGQALLFELISLPDLPFTWRCPIFLFVSNFYSERQKKEEGGREGPIGRGKYDTVPEGQDRAGWGCCSPYRTALLPPVLLLLHSGSLAPCCTREFDISNGTRLITSDLKSTRVTKSVPHNHAYCRPVFLFFSFSKPGGCSALRRSPGGGNTFTLHYRRGKKIQMEDPPPLEVKSVMLLLVGINLGPDPNGRCPHPTPSPSLSLGPLRE